MKFYRADEFTGTRPWEALDLSRMEDATVRLHWTDEPYIWHVNDGAEVFVVLDGTVEMRYRVDGVEMAESLTPGSVCVVDAGDEHVAHPAPEARVLVIEKAGSV